MTSLTLLVFAMPVAIVAGIFFGRMQMRRVWRLDLPYKDRPVWDTRYGGMSVPIIKDGVWPL